MKKYRILIWFPYKHDYYDGIFKSLNLRDDTECRDKSDFGIEANYYSQKDYEKIQLDFHANIVLLYQITRKELFIDISDDVIVWTYLDDIFGKYVMLGKDYFKNFPKKNYLYLPVLDVEAFDIDRVMQLEGIGDKAVAMPFVPLCYDNDVVLGNDEKKKYSCDIALIQYTRRIGDAPVKRMMGINNDNMLSKEVMQLMGFLYISFKNEMTKCGHIVTDINWIERLLIKYFDEHHIWQYTRNKTILLDRWKRFAFYIINVSLYSSMVVDWLIERDYDIKLYGGWEEKKFRKYSMGYLKDGSIEVLYANRMAKIGINSNPMITIHRRTLDFMSNGTMCLSAAAGKEESDAQYNFSHYSHFFENKKSIVMFYNKDELFKSIDYYLTHNKEREEIALAGKEAILDKRLNYGNIVNQAFDILRDRMERNGDKLV